MHPTAYKGITSLPIGRLCLENLATLVIGNAAYIEVGELQNPVNDASEMAARLETLGFLTRLTTRKMVRSSSV